MPGPDWVSDFRGEEHSFGCGVCKLTFVVPQPGPTATEALDAHLLEVHDVVRVYHPR